MRRLRSFLSAHQAEIDNAAMLLLFVVPHIALVLKYGVGVWGQIWQAGPALVILVGLCGFFAGIFRWKWPAPGLRLILVSMTEVGVALASGLILLQRIQLGRGLFGVVCAATVLGLDWIVGLALNRLGHQKR